MSTFIVSSDWHIGAPMNSAGCAAESFKEKKYEAVSQILKVIKEKKAKALFILGDLFDSDRVGEPDILKTCVFLSKIKCPIYIMPGNHDWWHQGGTMYAFSSLCENNQNIHILLKNEPLKVDELPEITFFPSPITQKNPINDTSEWIPERSNEHGIRIGLLHGGIDTVPGGNIPKDVTKIRDLDFTILGDWHNPVKIDEKTFYCGSLEPMGFDEKHEGQILIVEIEDGKLKVEPEKVGKLAWHRIEIKLEPKEVGGQGCQSLIQEVDKIDTPPESTVIRLHLSGNLYLDELNELDRYLAELRLRGWGHVDFEDIHVEPVEDIDLNTFPDAIKEVMRQVMNSDVADVVKRRALIILKSKLEAIQ